MDQDVVAQRVDAGRAEGEVFGESLGNEEGEEVGAAAGERLGAELGTIKGSLIAWRHLASQDAAFCSERAEKSLASLEGLVDAFPRTNTPDEDFMKHLSLCRAKFKVVKSLLGITDPFKSAKSLAF